MKNKEKQTAAEIIENAKKVAFYSRVSTDEQNIHTHQKGVVESYLNRYGKKYLDSFTDEISAYSKGYDERKELNELLHAVENNEYDAIIVSDRDRLSRQTDEHFELREKLKRLGIPVIIASQNELYSDEDFIKSLVEDALTKLESDTISTRTRATMRSLADKGQYIGGKPPFGYKVLKKPERKYGKDKQVVYDFEPIPEEISIVKEIFRLYRCGETFSSIAKLFSIKAINQADVYKAKNWSSNTIKGIILNPIYTGNFVYNRYSNEKGIHSYKPEEEWTWKVCPFIDDPPISVEEWWFCWYKYKKFSKKEPRFLNTPFYFTKKIQCHCGHEMRGKDQRTKGKNGYDGYRYYICTSCKCKVVAEELHQLFFEVMDDNMFTPQEYVFQEVMSLIEQDLDENKMVLANMKSKITEERNNLEIYSKFIKKNIDTEDVLLFESDNPSFLAYLISKKNSEDKLEKYIKRSNQLEVLINNLENLIDNDHVIREGVDEFFTKKSWQDLSDLELRNIVLLVVDDCTLTTPNKVKFKLKSVPPKNRKLVGIRK